MGRVAEFWGGTRVSTSPGMWVAAAPFRAHFTRLMAIGNLTADEMAEVTRISRRAARRLLHGRDDGRAVRRICPDVARRVLRVGPDDVVDLDRRTVPSGPTVQRLVDLLQIHGRIDLLARQLDVDAAELWALVYGAPTCTKRLAVRVGVAGEDLAAQQYRDRPIDFSSTGHAFEPSLEELMAA